MDPTNHPKLSAYSSAGTNNQLQNCFRTPLPCPVPSCSCLRHASRWLKNPWLLLFLWILASMTQFQCCDLWQVLPAPLRVPLDIYCPILCGLASHWKHHFLPETFLRLQEHAASPPRVGRSPGVSILWEYQQWQMGVGGFTSQHPAFKKEVNLSLPETFLTQFPLPCR